jgi:glutamate-1-semialdehyde 2,1-aminomutase
MEEEMAKADVSNSAKLMERARKVIPGGVNSPVRAFRAVGGVPLFISRASGSRIFDEDNREYVDYLGSWGPMILGHAHPEVLTAITDAASRGTSYGAPTRFECRLAELICGIFPSIESVRLVNSGTEATMSALRLARAYTNRNMIVKFDGCYHGHSDSLLVKAGSGVATLGLPGTPGVPPPFVEQTLSLPFNDLPTVESAFSRYPEQIAAIIVEPVPANMGVVPPEPGFLEGLLRVAKQHGAVAIFDEVITGFRLALGGAQEVFSLQPDLTCLGKILGGGLPVGAYGGRRDIMELLAPQGPVYQAGTLSGNPLAVCAGVRTLGILQKTNPYWELEQKTRRICDGLRESAGRHRIPLQVAQFGSLFTPFFCEGPVRNFTEAMKADTRRYADFFHGMLEQGVYLAPSQYEAGFLSVAHTDADLDKTLAAADIVLSAMTRPKE